MTAPPSSIHKKLIYASAGCAAVLVVVVIIGLVSARRLGLEPPSQPRYTTPLQSSAAVDSLSRFEFSNWLSSAGAERELRCRGTDTSQRVEPVAPVDSLDQPFSFGDTFPPGTVRRDVWERFGANVHIVPAEGATTPAESLPTGLQLLSAVRSRVQHRDQTGACVVLAALVLKVGALESDQHLDALVLGAATARDAADMVARDAELQQLTGLSSARAGKLLVLLDDQRQALRDLRMTIDAAGNSPASADSLARWALDDGLPLPVRDAFVQAIGYGWINDPPEMTFSPNGTRREAVARLLASGLPEPLARTARDAQRVLQGNLAQRFQFAVTYRTHREMQR